jgi:isopentenyldiphosphate isomerase
MLEIWDWDTGKPTGRSVERTKSHREGIAHEGVHLWVIRKEKGEWYLLFQKRADDKDTFPGVLDITVGGHVPFGQGTSKIQKEAYEEIGISPEPGELIDLGYFRYEEEWDWMFHREFQRVYLLEDNRPLDSYRFHDGEVSGIYAVPIKEMELLFSGGKEIQAMAYHHGRLEKVPVSRDDLHPLFFTGPMSPYLDVLFRAIDQYINRGRATVRMEDTW